MQQTCQNCVLSIVYWEQTIAMVTHRCIGRRMMSVHFYGRTLRQFCWMIVTCTITLGEVIKAQLSGIFANRAASTLKKHLCGWCIWWEFCRNCSWCMAGPSLVQLLDLESLREGVRMDRGHDRKNGAIGVIAAMKYTASRLQLCDLLGKLGSPLLEPWGRCGKWFQCRPCEATPLSFVMRL